MQRSDALTVYWAIGQGAPAVAKVIDDLERHKPIKSSLVLVATGEDPLQALDPRGNEDPGSPISEDQEH